jgi:hypothetical protein
VFRCTLWYVVHFKLDRFADAPIARFASDGVLNRFDRFDRFGRFDRFDRFDCCARSAARRAER